MPPAEYHQECEARSKMWASLIPEYREANRNKKKKLKQEYHKMIDKMFATPIASPTYCVSIFDDCTTQSSPDAVPIKKFLEAPRKGNDNMYVEQNMTVTEKTTEDTRRQYFLNELISIFSKKEEELRHKFGLSIRKSPKTPTELVEWIKAGEYTFTKGYDPEDEDSWDRWESPINGFRWTKVKEDRKGYDAAYAALRSSRDSFRNEIWAEVDPANFIKILAKFEKATIH